MSSLTKQERTAKIGEKIKLLFWIAVILVNFMFPEPNK